MAPLRSLFPAISLVLSLAAPPAFGIGVDDFSNAFPPNPCLPNSGQAVIFSGLFCDGAACPPDPMASCALSGALQTGLSGVLAGAKRDAVVSGQVQETNLHAVVNTASNRLEVVTEENAQHFARIAYYGDTELDLNFVSLGVEAVRFSVGGDVSPTMPLDVEVLLVDLAFPNRTAYKVLTLTAPGNYVTTLAELTLINGFDFMHVDVINVSMGDCFQTDCTGTPKGPRSYWFGPLSLDTHPVPVNPSSWGAVKSRYR
jgi:hypothetical protein